MRHRAQMALRPRKITMDAVWHTRVSVLRIPVVRAALHYPDGIAIYLAYDAVAVIGLQSSIRLLQ